MLTSILLESLVRTSRERGFSQGFFPGGFGLLRRDGCRRFRRSVSSCQIVSQCSEDSAPEANFGTRYHFQKVGEVISIL